MASFFLKNHGKSFRLLDQIAREAGTDHEYVDGCDCIPIKIYLQKQVASWIQSNQGSLVTLVYQDLRWGAATAARGQLWMQNWPPAMFSAVGCGSWMAAQTPASSPCLALLGTPALQEQAFELSLCVWLRTSGTNCCFFHSGTLFVVFSFAISGCFWLTLHLKFFCFGDRLLSNCYKAWSLLDDIFMI